MHIGVDCDSEFLRLFSLAFGDHSERVWVQSPEDLFHIPHDDSKAAGFYMGAAELSLGY